MRIVVASDAASREACFAIRRRVFIEEQQIPEAEEWDEADATATHVLARDGDRPAATARMTVSGVSAKIGRVAVLPAYRGTGLGRRIMEYMMTLAREARCTGVVLEAQVYAIPFYERLGFVAEGPEFDDGSGILHRRMHAAMSAPRVG